MTESVVPEADVKYGSPSYAMTVDEWETMRKQVAEIHAFIEVVGQALNNPMLRAMMPPGMRAQIDAKNKG